MTRAAILRDPVMPPGSANSPPSKPLRRLCGVELSPVDVRDSGEIERAVTAFAERPNGALDRNSGLIRDGPSRADHRARGAAPAAGGLFLPLLRRERRPDLLRA